MGNRKFEGWYFKHQLGDDVIALIPGRSAGGAFVQMLCPDGARYFPVPRLFVKSDVIYAGNCLFSPHGCKIDLPGVKGEITYGRILPLKSDIMGPFQFFPMECRHGVISMAHTLYGSLTVDGTVHNFDGGTGYLEKDSGTSFPSSYQWLQCSDFPEPCSLMVSIARIPFCGLHFTGCICAIIYKGREYRLASYRGVRILAADEKHICLSQENWNMRFDIFPSGTAHPLKSPVSGCMTGTIRERANVGVHVCLRDGKNLIFDLCSPHAAYEYVPPKKEASPQQRNRRGAV